MKGIVALLGIAALLAGVVLYFYSVGYTESVYGVMLITRIETPYRDIGTVLLIFGIIGLVLGFLLPNSSESTY